MSNEPSRIPGGRSQEEDPRRRSPKEGPQDVKFRRMRTETKNLPLKKLPVSASWSRI